MFEKMTTKKSCRFTFDHFKKTWTIICVTAAISTMIWQLSNYLSGQDSTIVEFREFNKDEIDVYPNIAICFSKYFDKEKLIEIGQEVAVSPDELNRAKYNLFLYGEEKKEKINYHWKEKMLDIDFDKVSRDFQKFIVKYELKTDEFEDIVLYDKKNKTTSLKDLPEFQVKSIFGNKCFSLNFPFKRGQKLTQASVVMLPDIFPSKSRPSTKVRDPIGDDMFSVVLHYPKQLLRKISTQQMNWPDRSQYPNKAYLMEFNIRNTEVIEKRNKYDMPCADGIPDFDDEITGWIIHSTGCKPQFWNSFPASLPICSTQEQLQNIRKLLTLIFSDQFEKANYTGQLPCRSLERIQFEAMDIEMKGVKHSAIQLKFRFREFTYKEVKSVRSMDLQGLIGN